MKSFPYLLLIIFSAIFSKAQVSSDFETDSITTHTLAASSFISDDEGWLADNAGLLWHTSNSGQSWSSVSTEKNFVKLDFTDAQHGYGITSDGAFKTSDGGSTWSTLSLPGSIGSALYFLDANTGFISGTGAIYKTTNGGSTWSTISTEGVNFVDYYFISGSIGVAAAFDDNDTYQCIWRTTDGGATWGNVYHEENYFITSVWFIDENNGWAAGYKTIAGRGNLPVINHTTDGGVTWENVYINRHPGDMKGEKLLDLRFKNADEGFALSDYSESIITSDGGQTWNLTYDSEETLIPSWGIYQTLGGNNDMYLCGKKGYVTKWK